MEARAPSYDTQAGDGWAGRLLLGAGILLVVVAAPLSFSWGVAASFFTPKVLPLYVGTGLVLTGALLSWSDPRASVAVDRADLIAGAFLAWGLVATFLASSRSTAFFGLYNQGTGWLFWMAALLLWATARRVSWTDRRFEALLGTVVAAGVLVAGLGLLQAAGWEPLRMRLGFRPDGRAGTTLGNPLYAGSYLSLALIASLVLGRRVHDWTRFAAWGASFLVFAGLAATGSRGAWLGAGGGVVALAVTSAPPRTWRRRHVLGAAAAGVLALMVIVAVLGLTDTSGQSLRRLTQTGSLTQRLELWRVAARTAASRPVTGWGPNNYRYGAESSMTAARLEAEPLTRDSDAHDLPLELAATYGVVGAVAWAAWFGVVVLGLVGRARAGDQPMLARSGIAILVAFAVASLTMPQNLAVTPTVLLLVAAGLPPGGDATWLPRLSMGRIAPVLVGAAVLGTGLASWWGVTVVQADRQYLRGELEQSIPALRSAAAAVPGNPFYWNSLGRAQARLGFDQTSPPQLDGAVGSFEQGLAAAPRELDLLNGLTAVLMDRGSWDQARIVAERAVGFAPIEPQPRANLAVILVTLGSRDAGLAQARRALSVDVESPRVFYTVGIAYRRAGDEAAAHRLFDRALSIDPAFVPAQRALQAAAS